MSKAESLARLWIECWNQSRPDDIPLAENFVHTSPFGRVEGREVYLEWVKPLAAQNVAQLDIQRSMGTDDEAVVHFEMTTPTGVISVCDWVSVKDNEIVAVHSLYDASELKSQT